MRTIAHIKDAIKIHRDIISELEAELEDFKQHCPHPSHFVESKISDVEDDCGGPGIYEYSWVTYECSLCEGKFSKEFNKNREKAPLLQEIMGNG